MEIINSCSQYQNRNDLLHLQKVRTYKFFQFKDILEDASSRGTKIQTGDYLIKGKYPIVDQGKKLIAGYVNDKEGIFEDVPCIIFGDHTRCIKHIDEPIFLGADGTKLLKSKFSEEQISTKYIYYFLNNIDIPNTGYNRHFKYIKDIVFPIPPIETQNKIVEVLDKAQALIDTRKDQIKLLGDLIQSVFYDLFGDPVTNPKGWDLKKLGECSTINPKKSEVSDIGDIQVSFVPMTNVSEKGDIFAEETKSITEVYKGFTYFRENDVLFAKITPCMENGKGCIAKGLKNGLGFGSTEFHVIRPEKELNAQYIYQLTALKQFRLSAESSMKGAVGQKRVPADFLRDYNAPVPPLDLQNQFAEIVQKIESQKQRMKKSLEEMENNYNSLMQRAFKGELFN